MEKVLNNLCLRCRFFNEGCSGIEGDKADALLLCAYYEELEDLTL